MTIASLLTSARHRSRKSPPFSGVPAVRPASPPTFVHRYHGLQRFSHLVGPDGRYAFWRSTGGFSGSACNTRCRCLEATRSRLILVSRDAQRSASSAKNEPRKPMITCFLQDLTWPASQKQLPLERPDRHLPHRLLRAARPASSADHRHGHRRRHRQTPRTSDARQGAAPPHALARHVHASHALSRHTRCPRR